MRTIEFLEGTSERVEEALKLVRNEIEYASLVNCFFHLMNKALIYKGDDIKLIIGPDHYAKGSFGFAVFDGERRLINGGMIMHEREHREWSIHT